MCLGQGACDPLIENELGIFSKVTAETVNVIAIESINVRIPPPTWKAGLTSLLGESFSEVLAYRMGELPPSSVERTGNKGPVQTFLREMDENANAIVI